MPASTNRQFAVTPRPRSLARNTAVSATSEGSVLRFNGARVWIVSEYGHVPVNRPIYLNRALRQADLLNVRPGPFGEAPDLFNSRAWFGHPQAVHMHAVERADRWYLSRTVCVL